MKTQRILSSLVLAHALLFSVECTAQSNDAATTQPAPAAQSSDMGVVTFPQGSNVLNIGLGIGGSYNYYYFAPGYAETPNFVASYENGTFGNVGPGTISLGGLLAYTGTSYSYFNPGNGYTYNNNWNYWILGFRSAYHWNFTHSTRFDPYIGLMLGYYYVGYTHSTNDPHAAEPGDPGYVYYSATYANYLALSAYLGARYYVSNNVGLWAELGYGYTNLALGVSFKL